MSIFFSFSPCEHLWFSVILSKYVTTFSFLFSVGRQDGAIKHSLLFCHKVSVAQAHKLKMVLFSFCAKNIHTSVSTIELDLWLFVISAVLIAV